MLAGSTMPMIRRCPPPLSIPARDGVEPLRITGAAADRHEDESGLDGAEREVPLLPPVPEVEGYVGAHQGVEEILEALQGAAAEAAGLQDIGKGPRAQGWLPVFPFDEDNLRSSAHWKGRVVLGELWT